MTADARGHDFPDGEDAARLTDAQRSLRVQMLATEHWGLLASRSTTQSEVLTRIAIFLTLVSVGLFALGVMGNATQFRGWFGVAALGVLLLLVVLGMITQERVFNSSAEDLVYVFAMNRLRGAYVDLDAGIERYLMTSPADDPAGAGRTYYPFRRSDGSHFFASSMMVMLTVETVLVGLFAGSLTFALSGSIGWSIGVGVVAAIASCVLWARRGFRSYSTVMRMHEPLRTSAAPSGRAGGVDAASATATTVQDAARTTGPTVQDAAPTTGPTAQSDGPTTGPTPADPALRRSRRELRG